MTELADGHPPLATPALASPSTGVGWVLEPGEAAQSREELRRAESGPAVFSADRLYRYSLGRTWALSGRLVVIGLNPSTADHNQLDPTLRRVRNFAQTWGLGGFVMLNLFAYRATDPRDMKRADDPVGPLNDDIIREYAVAPDTGLVLAAWGAHGGYRDRDREVAAILDGLGVRLHALRVTRQGHPSHPLYIPGNAVPRPYVLR